MTGRVGHLLAVQGLSGDMWLGVLIDAGAAIDRLQAAVDALGLGDIRLEATQVSCSGTTASHVDVVVPEDARPVRTLEAATTMLTRARLDEEVRGRALAAYRALAAAEAEAHGTTLDEVHFHELGHPDTAVDIVAACAGVSALGLDQLTCGPVAVGSGIVRTAHGELPVPAPAVTSLLRGFVIHGGSRDRELTTPTGAVLAKTLAQPVRRLPPLQLEAHGRGASDADGEKRSVLTLLVGTDASAPI